MTRFRLPALLAAAAVLSIAAVPAEGRVSVFWDPARAPGGLPPARQRWAARAWNWKLDHLATRLFDAAGAGDNFLCVLRRPA